MQFSFSPFAIMASVTIYNTPEDVDALLENLENVRKVMGL